jgi:hypothetical protein
MRTHTTIRPLAGALLAACALAVAACGEDGGSDGGATGASERDKGRQAALDHAQCMREHGVDMPDPQFDGGRIMQRGPDENVPREKLEEAEKACEKYLESVEGPELTEEQQQEFRERALAHSECMREHGIENFPDPTFDEDGGAQIQIGPGSGLDPDDPEFREAEEACEDEMPEPPEESGQ